MLDCTLRKLYKEEKMRNKGSINACMLCEFTNGNKQEKQHISQHLEFIYQTKILMTYHHHWKLQNLERNICERAKTTKQLLYLAEQRKGLLFFFHNGFVLIDMIEFRYFREINFAFFGRSTLSVHRDTN